MPSLSLTVGFRGIGCRVWLWDLGGRVQNLQNPFIRNTTIMQRVYEDCFGSISGFGIRVSGFGFRV